MPYFNAIRSRLRKKEESGIKYFLKVEMSLFLVKCKRLSYTFCCLIYAFNVSLPFLFYIFILLSFNVLNTCRFVLKDVDSNLKICEKHVNDQEVFLRILALFLPVN